MVRKKVKLQARFGKRWYNQGDFSYKKYREFKKVFKSKIRIKPKKRR